MTHVERYLAPTVITQMQNAIAEAQGNEVFFVGYTEEDLIVHVVDVIARGNEIAVPAVLEIARDADVVIHNHPSGYLSPSNADLQIAMSLDDYSVAFYIVNNPVDNIYVVVEPFKKSETTQLNLQGLFELLEPGGPISNRLPNYEVRSQQQQMIENVAKAFNGNKISLIEAGTGTGKSLAYLIPAIHWAMQNKERVIVSTNTINLQEQLIQKDIPFLQKALNLNFQAVIVKGKSNYVCLRKVKDIQQELNLHADEEDQEELYSLIEWAGSTKEGSKADLTYVPRETTWEKIAAESDTCTRSKCPFFRECFVNKARREATRAHILVVNHHLLFADLALKHQIQGVSQAAILPPYERIVFDEAHHLENVATSYFGSRITRAGILRLLSRLYREHKGKQRGYLSSVLHKISHHKTSSLSLYNSINEWINHRLLPDLQTLTNMTNDLCDDFSREMQLGFGNDYGHEIKVRLTMENRDRLLKSTALENPVSDFLLLLRSFSTKVYRLIEKLDTLAKDTGDDWTSLITDIRAQADRLTMIAEDLDSILFGKDQETIRWLEMRPLYRGRTSLRFLQSPLDVSEMMNQAVYEPFDTVIMTSATLTVDQKFEFISKRIGLAQYNDPSRITELNLPPPFEYENQVLLGIPLDTPQQFQKEYVPFLANFIFKSLATSKGHAFVLFTSYGILEKVYHELAESLDMIGLAVLKQGSLNRHELIARFRKTPHSVLFATNSFWEGVDVIGKALQLVIITKLPFQVPNEPIVEARYEAIERSGGNPFMEHSLPVAVIKLRQGFGRLIRSRADRGAVLVLDNRIVKKSYGKHFLRSLPRCYTITFDQDSLFSELETFFKS
jgi:ATP-dependent DNA helicase DinG